MTLNPKNLTTRRNPVGKGEVYHSQQPIYPMNIIEAANLLKQGKKVRRQSWDNKDAYLQKDPNDDRETVYLTTTRGVEKTEDVHTWDAVVHELLADNWQEYPEPVEYRTFMQALVYLRQGHSIKRKDWESLVYCYKVGCLLKAKGGFYKLLTHAASLRPAEGSTLYADWEHGSTLKITLAPSWFRDTGFMEVSMVEFVPRKFQYKREEWEPLCY